MTWTYIVITLVSIFAVDASRILVVVPSPSISHQVPFRPYIEGLLKNGHEVVYITTDPMYPEGEAPSNLTEIDLHDVSYSAVRKVVEEMPMGEKSGFAALLPIMLFFYETVMESQFTDREVQKVINDETFDLLVLEAICIPLLALSHVFKAPVIQYSSGGAFWGSFEIIGAPEHPLLYPSPLRQRINDLSVWEKITEAYNFYLLQYVLNDYLPKGDMFTTRIFDPDMPPLKELFNNVDMLFLNNHPLWDSNRPVPPGVVYIGPGLHLKPVKPLPEDLKSYLDSSKNGVIYISFGSNVDPTLLPPEQIQQLVNVFSRLPYDVLWKWNGDELPGRTDNIRISKWLPQKDLLHHPKIKLFITQGGLQSTDEAISAGVPMLGMPMMGDQWFNVERYVQLKIGLKVEMPDLTEDKFKAAIETIIGDENYRQNIRTLSAQMYDSPQTNLERAIWWTEYVLRHKGAKQLRSPAANISWAQYFDSDVVLVLGLGILISLLIVGFISYLVLYYLKQTLSMNKIKND